MINEIIKLVTERAVIAESLRHEAKKLGSDPIQSYAQGIIDEHAFLLNEIKQIHGRQKPDE